MNIQKRTLQGRFGKGRREAASGQEAGTAGPLMSREAAVAGGWKERHVQWAALAGPGIWVKGQSHPKINLLGGSWEETAINPTPLFL